MKMETILAILLLMSSVLHILRFIWDRHEQRMKKLENDKPPISIPVASDAKFLRLQVRNPSWAKVYKAINAAIAKGEDHCEFWFYNCYGEAKIPYEELQDELGALGYRVEREVNDSCFSVWWG